MALGRKLHELSQLRVGLAVSFALALFAAFWSVEKISLSPLEVHARKLTMATASTSVLVDSRESAVLNLGVGPGEFATITSRALLVANVMASAEARRTIARFAGVPTDSIQVTSPVTPAWPRPLNRPGTQRSTSDILKSPEEYRLSLHSNPTVPEIDIFATAPTAEVAIKLANGAVAGAQEYVRTLAARQAVPSADQVRLRQLGQAQGAAINGGVSIRLALLAFVVVFITSCAATIVLARVRRDWHLAAAAAVPDPRSGA